MVRRLAWIGLAVLLVVVSALWLWAAAVYPRIYVENGPMENFQVGCLGVGALVLMWRARLADDRAECVLFAALALFYVTFLIREFDTRKFDWPIANAILSGTIRNVWLGALWVLTGYFVYRSRAKVVPLGLRWLRTPAGWLIVVAGAFWILGAGADKLEVFGSKPRDMLAEELLEINAALLMTLCAVVALKNTDGFTEGNEEHEEP